MRARACALLLGNVCNALALRYFKFKKAWNVAGIESGIPYTIVSQGAFAQWTFNPKDNFFIDHAARTVLHVGSAETKGWITTSFEDVARFTVDCVLDPAMANSRVAIAGATVSAADFAVMLTKASAPARVRAPAWRSSAAQHFCR